MKDHQEELMELKHEADPFYKKIFFIIFAICAVYLAFIFLKS
ncbi:MAG: hypothetical protein N3A59_00240 [Thermodesulfovibrionales bacterium]|nr:hypothetical protein [Thermodesulfovibrionales bacterium]